MERYKIGGKLGCKHLKMIDRLVFLCLLFLGDNCLPSNHFLYGCDRKQEVAFIEISN